MNVVPEATAVLICVDGLASANTETELRIEIHPKVHEHSLSSRYLSSRMALLLLLRLHGMML